MRNPDDPDIAPDSKAAAALCLAILGVATSVAIGGAVPATIAIILARQAQSEMDSSAGWLTGTSHARLALRLSWVALALAASAAVILVTMRLLQDVGPLQRDFPATVD